MAARRQVQGPAQAISHNQLRQAAAKAPPKMPGKDSSRSNRASKVRPDSLQTGKLADREQARPVLKTVEVKPLRRLIKGKANNQASRVRIRPINKPGSKASNPKARNLSHAADRLIVYLIYSPAFAADRARAVRRTKVRPNKAVSPADRANKPDKDNKPDRAKRQITAKRKDRMAAGKARLMLRGKVKVAVMEMTRIMARLARMLTDPRLKYRLSHL